jgi:hypothetical protein
MVNSSTLYTKTEHPHCKTNLSNRISAYSRYIEQFADTFPTIPEDVLTCIFRALSTVHFHTVYRCKPTAVVNILRQHGYVNLCYAAMRITMLFNGHTIPVLDSVLRARLVGRFGVLFRCSMLPTYTYKLPSFEIITHCCLRFEHRHDLTGYFSLNKTISVLEAVNKKIEILIELAAKIDSVYDWKCYHLRLH